MLLRIANEQHPVLFPKPRHELGHLLGAGQARLIDHVVTRLRHVRVRLGKVHLQSGRLDAGIAEFFRSSAGRSKAYDAKAMRLESFPEYFHCGGFAHAGIPLEGSELIAAAHDILHGGLLRLIQMRKALGRFLRCPALELRPGFFGSDDLS